MVPAIALVGRKNVGKSTLFNKLTHTNNALIVDYPGLTRDRRYGCVRFEGRKFICIDTGGIDGIEEIAKVRHDEIEFCVTKQSLIAIEEANAILFIVDAHTGLVPADLSIFEYLRSKEKSIFLVVNKIDGIDINQVMADFWIFGLEIYPIIASHGQGISNLLKAVLIPFIDKITLSKNLNKKIAEKKKKDFCSKELPIKLAIVGCPNVGKSTLANYLVGKNRMIVFHTPGTTRDSTYIPMQHDERKYIIIDTAGVRRRKKIEDVVEKLSVIKSLQSIEEANVALLVIDAEKGISFQDLSLLRFILNNGCSLVVALNKWDALNRKSKNQVKKILKNRLAFISFSRIHFISALYGRGIGDLLKSINETYDSSIRRVSTAMLTHIMYLAVENHQPPLVHGHRAKLKYAHSGGHNPLVVIIHGNLVKSLPASYKRYLMNYFRKSLDIIGTQIHIQFREGSNPYVKNICTNIKLIR